ncbi:lantibiotic dehydratase, partial [Streptomyces sp. NPDC059786]|uniref:lantibiotic dehydratase n=1 Tax=Streptomyces sp. NPDC059786 TaxID=3346946 RepID=UPI003648F1E1
RVRPATPARRRRALLTTARPLHVDPAVDAGVRHPPAGARAAERAADLLWRLAPGGGEPAHLRRYHADFLERYGVGRLVPLEELLDPDIGLGAPAGYRHPRSGRAAVPDRPGDAERRRDQVMAALVSRAQSTGSREIVLDEDVIGRIQAKDAKPALPSMELCGRVVAADLPALTAGDFTLWLSGTSGSRLAGAMAGRFAHLLGPDTRRLLAPATDGDTDTDSDADADADADAPIAAQLSLQGAWLRAGNVSQVPNQLDHRITVGGFADRGDPKVLGLRDLAVCAWPDRLALVSTALGREITPAAFHMLNMRAHAPNLARFLSEVALSGRRSWEPWTWGSLDVLPCLPRVRHGRTVLAAARWRTDEPFFEEAWFGDAEWRRALDDWRQRWRVPEQVLLADGDRYLQLDLTSAAHARTLRQERSRSAAVLFEVPGGTAAPGWLAGDGGAHSHEVVFPLTARAPHTPAGRKGTARRAVVPVVRAAGDVARPPGSGWLYAKLYSSEQRQDEILVHRLPHLLAASGSALRRWFFIRYRDPEPHLRLRLFAGEPGDAGRLLPVLGAWAAELRSARLCGRMVLDTYEPEVERYGGPAALALAEEVFQADSESVLAQLTARQERSAGPAGTVGPAGPAGLDPVLLVALNYLDILHHLNGPATGGPGPAWLLETRATHQDRAVFRPHRRAALDLADPGGRWERLAATPGGQAITDSWTRRAEALHRYAARLAAQPGGSQPGSSQPSGPQSDGPQPGGSHSGGSHSGGSRSDGPQPGGSRSGGPLLGGSQPAETVLSSVLHMHHNRLAGIDREAEHRSHAIARGAVQAVLDKRRFTR